MKSCHIIICIIRASSIADSGRQDWTPQLDKKPLLAIEWSGDVGSAKLPFSQRVILLQLVRMKARPQEQAWVAWKFLDGSVVAERVADIVLPCIVELHMSDGNDVFDGGLHFFREWMMAVKIASVGIGTCIAYECISHATGPLTRAITSVDEEVEHIHSEQFQEQ